VIDKKHKARRREALAFDPNYMQKKLLIIAGTRPEMIKLAPVVRELGGAPWAAPELVLTGQHSEMMQPLLQHFGITNQQLLPIQRKRGTLSELIGEVSRGLDHLIATTKPDGVVVQGDTTSAMAAAICGYSDRFPVFHVEAGLRSFDMEQPFPEEFNRRVISLAATLHFAPTDVAQAHLVREGIPASRCHVVGNTVIDALLWTVGKSGKESSKFRPESFRILATCHRRESWDSGLDDVCRALAKISDRFKDAHILFPVHPNPRVRSTVEKLIGGEDRITLCAPMDYRDFCSAMEQADLIISDSGGVQEEALALGKPTLVTRWKTERPEVLEWDTVRLIGPDCNRIFDETVALREDKEHYAKCAIAAFPFGKGDASAKIVEIIGKFLNS